MPGTSECPVCRQSKPKRWDLCRDCLHIYGSVAADWPEWLRLIINDNARVDYDERKRNTLEIPIGDFELFEDMAGDLDEPLWTRPGDEMMMTHGPLGAIPLPFAPYDNEDMNRAYRKANNIPEPFDILIDDEADADEAVPVMA